MKLNFSLSTRSKFSVHIQSLLFVGLIVLSSSVSAQNYRRDVRSESYKKDMNNVLQADEFTKVDLLNALSFAGIQIHKFELAAIDQKAELVFYLEEMKHGELVSTDTLFRMTNVYNYTMNGNSYYDYLKSFTLLSSQDDDELKLRFQTYSREFSETVKFYPSTRDQFYNIRYYSNTDHLDGGGAPLLIFASSWSLGDEKMQRFSGAVHLVRGASETNSLLKNSPHYYIVSYCVK